MKNTLNSKAQEPIILPIWEEERKKNILIKLCGTQSYRKAKDENEKKLLLR